MSYTPDIVSKVSYSPSVVSKRILYTLLSILSYAYKYSRSPCFSRSDAIKLVIRRIHVHGNINKIPYYNSNYDDPEYLAEKGMHVARENMT